MPLSNTEIAPGSRVTRESTSAAKGAYEKYLAIAPDAKNGAEIKRRLEKLK